MEDESGHNEGVSGRMESLVINGIPVVIERRKVKNINLYIKPPDGHILITAPATAPRRRILDFIQSKMEWIEKARRRVEASTDQRDRMQQEEISAEAGEQMKREIKRYLDKWEPVMGVKASCITVRKMKTRWGSCSVDTGRIRLNARLALYPEECLEYVIVHELCHLLEPSHNRRFKELMTQFLPDWKERRKKLAQ